MKRIIVLAIFCGLVFTGRDLRANALVAIDLAGQVAEPLVGVAKDKAQGLLKFIYVLPYGGYGFGDGSFSLGGTTGITGSAGLTFEGLMFGGQAGLEVMNFLRLGADYSRQIASYTVNHNFIKTKSISTGILLSTDIPSTPFQLHGVRYFSAKLGEAKGTGWGIGLSMILRNPFVLMLEYRMHNYSIALDSAGTTGNTKIKQYVANLGIMLF
jgi:hypothetical protein